MMISERILKYCAENLLPENFGYGTTEHSLFSMLISVMGHIPIGIRQTLKK